MAKGLLCKFTLTILLRRINQPVNAEDFHCKNPLGAHGNLQKTFYYHLACDGVRLILYFAGRGRGLKGEKLEESVGSIT